MYNYSQMNQEELRNLVLNTRNCHAQWEAILRITVQEYLKEIALLRLENPDASLKVLGEMLENPIGKSGVNHRLQKIHDFAEELRQGK